MLFTFPHGVFAQGPQPTIFYLYDDLNRLVRAIRQDGEAATYHYDAVGNILSITRESGVPQTTVVSGVSTSTLPRSHTTPVTLTGFNFSGAEVTTTCGIHVTGQQTDVDTLVLQITVDPTATLGSCTLTIRTPYGTVTVPVTVIGGAPVVTGFAPAKALAGMVVTVTGGEFDPGAPANNIVRVNGIQAAVLQATSSTLTIRVPAGATTGPVSVTTASGTGSSSASLIVGSLGPRRAAIPTTDLLAYWTFDLDGQDAAAALDLRLEGGLGATVLGAFGHALAFSGDPNQFAVRPVNDPVFNFGAADFALSLWARWNTTAGEQVLIEKCEGVSFCNGGGWTLTKLSDNRLLMTPFLLTPPGAIVAGQWYHIAVVRQGGTVTIYLNGAVAAEGTVDGTRIAPMTDPLRVGRRASSQLLPMNGVIDEIGVWNRALTVREVATLAATSDLLGPAALSDTFTGAVIDSAKWEVSAPLGASTVTQDNALLVTSDGTLGTFSTTPGLIGPGAGVGSRCVLSGNFDIQASFSALSAPATNFTQAFFNVSQDAQNQLHIKRLLGASPNGIQTVFLRQGAAGPGPVSPFAGTAARFRITRDNGSDITTFADTGAGFEVHRLATGLFGGDVVASLVLLGPGGATTSVTYDDFIVNSGTVICPVAP